MAPLSTLGAGTVARFADAVVPVERPEATPAEVAGELFRFLSLYRSRRKWRVRWVILGLEIIPLLAGRKPLFLMRPEERRSFVNEKLRTSEGLWGKVAMGKQLVLLAYYGLGRSEARLGYVRPDARPTVRSRLARAPAPGVRRT
ncbi:MAG: hypothetical protein HC813_02295 [Planctomycetes bacterium]|nr:hypothetical protein [Planctomycetota bacterium]